MSPAGEQIRVRGLVQGVGFRPTVWRLARDLGLAGDVRNDGTGVLIRLWGEAAARDAFCARLQSECPPLARIQSLFFKTPLVHAFIWGSSAYHDRYWWPVHGKPRMAEIASTPWGRLFEAYE